MSKKYITGCMLSLMIVMGLAVGTLPRTAAAEESQVQDSGAEHVLKEENNWDIKDELIMPGESFYTKPKYEFSYEKLQAGVEHFTAWPRYLHAAITLNKPDGDENGKVWWRTDTLVRSTVDTSKVVSCGSNSYNVIKMAYDRGDLSALQGDETCKDTLQAALKGQTTANVGYQNNTGLPMVLEQVRGGSTMDEGTVYGGKYGDDLLVDAWSTHNWGCVIRFYEPYYTLSYEFDGADGEFTDEEKRALPDRYYIQREKQEFNLKNPVRAGHHFVEWQGGLVGAADVSQSKESTILSFDWAHNLYGSGMGIGDQTVRACFEKGQTVTFHPNGGTLKSTDSAVREIDVTEAVNDLFFDISECVPVRDGYRFVGWCTYSDAEDTSLIKNTKDSTWISDWVLDAFHGLHADEYDIHLYAKWEKEVVSNNEQKTQENVQKEEKTKEEVKTPQIVPVQVSETVKKTDIVKPKGTKIVKLKAGKKKITVKWKKLGEDIAGYQIQYSLSSKFKKVKTVTVSNKKTVRKQINKLKSKRKYYVKIRTYRIVNDKENSTKSYSSWSKMRSVKVK